MPGYSLDESPAEFRVAKCQLHGVLVQVYDKGLLLIGESGVGKTAAAMQLLRRGHAFIADDAVQVFHRGEHFFGGAAPITRSLVHIRGVGISSVVDLFHHAALHDECRIDACVEIFGHRQKLDLPTMTERTQGMLDVPFFRIKAGSPAAVADSIEAIARGQLIPDVP